MLLIALLPMLQAPDPTPRSGEAPSGASRYAVVIPRIDEDVKIDGRLDEPAWGQAARLINFSQYQPVDSRPAEEETEVLVWYSPSAIHFGIIAHDRQPQTIRATKADRDNIDNDDYVTIYLDTFNDRRRAFFFSVNPLGVQQDGVRSEGASSAGNLFGGTIDRNPDYFYDSKGRITDQGYVVEVRIPFKSLRYQGSGPQKWGLNILRRVQRTGYDDTWTDARRANASFLLQAGTIEGLHDLHRGMVLEAQPFMTSTANGRRDSNGSFSRGRVQGDAGLNLRLGFTNLSLDATGNPDFSQVESDQGQVTLNERFALFFPEKRPFFLEGIELFSTSNQLVYTRQIANPIAGAKITGKLGPLGLAHLTAVDEDVDGTSHEALFNITRVRRDFGTNSVAGITYTDRSLFHAADYNRVLAGDIRVVFAKLYYVEGQLGGSWSRDGLGSQKAPIWKLEYDRTGRSWGFNYRMDAFGQGFESRAGFVPRNDIIQAHAFNRLTWYGARGAMLESFTTFFGPSRIWRYGHLGGDAIEGADEVTGLFHLRGGWEIRAVPRRRFVDFEPANYAGYTVSTSGGPMPFQPLGGVAGPSFSLQMTTPTYRTLNAQAGISRGRGAIFQEAARATQTSLNAAAALRPLSSVRITASTTVEWLRRSRDRSEFARTVIPRLKLEFQPSRPLFFRVVSEYRSERRAALKDDRSGDPILIGGAAQPATSFNGLRVDLLASFEPTPGTVAFFGYGSSMESDQELSFSRLRRASDGFFVKLAYQIRR